MNNIIKLILIVLVILFAVYVWPTPYRYMPDYLSGRVPFRIHRITDIGEAWFQGTGWTKLE
ncbi:hypothetical protein ES708_28732 [subsurface metagenome]